MKLDARDGSATGYQIQDENGKPVRDVVSVDTDTAVYEQQTRDSNGVLQFDVGRKVIVKEKKALKIEADTEKKVITLMLEAPLEVAAPEVKPITSGLIPQSSAPASGSGEASGASEAGSPASSTGVGDPSTTTAE